MLGLVFFLTTFYGVSRKKFAFKFIEVGVRAAICKPILSEPARSPHLKIDLTYLGTNGNGSPYSHLNEFQSNFFLGGPLYMYVCITYLTRSFQHHLIPCSHLYVHKIIFNFIIFSRKSAKRKDSVSKQQKAPRKMTQGHVTILLSCGSTSKVAILIYFMSGGAREPFTRQMGSEGQLSTWNFGT